MNHPIYHTYEDELQDLAYEPNGLLNYLFHKFLRRLTNTSDQFYSFTVPVSDYLRAELFCKDVEEISEMQFRQRELISLLLDDFLFQAKERSNPYDLYKELEARSQQNIQVYQNKRKLNAKTSTSKTKTIQCAMKRREALRLEVMLSDIADIQENRIFTIEDVLQIIYCDFIYKYKTGQLTNVIKSIIQRLSGIKKEKS